jgi:hypothetical protein
VSVAVRYEDSYLAYTTQSVGVRDTRRIVGDYTLTDEDVLQGRTFEDGIGRYGSVMDVHDKSGSLVAVGGSGWFHIPFRSLIPQGVENLLVAGRCISAEYNALGSVRSQAASMVTGQAGRHVGGSVGQAQRHAARTADQQIAKRPDLPGPDHLDRRTGRACKIPSSLFTKMGRTLKHSASPAIL